jgi:salicylate hydroxylase
LCHAENTFLKLGVLLPFHRPDFQRVLLENMPSSCGLHCSKRLRTYTQHPTGTIELLFEDNTRADCDLLIGADGIRSAVRKAMLQEKTQQAKSRGNVNEAKEFLASVDPIWSGTVSYRTVVPAEKLRAYAPDHRVLSSANQVIYHAQSLSSG